MATTSSVVISLLLLSAAFFCCRAARDPSLDDYLPYNPAALNSKGNEFYVAFSRNDMDSDPVVPVSLFITTDEPVDVSVRVTSDFGPYNVSLSTGYGRHAIFSLPLSPIPGLDFRVSDISQRNKAIYIKAEGDRTVSVYGFNQERMSSDAFQVFPCRRYAIDGNYAYMVMSERGHETETRQSQTLMVGCDKGAIAEVNIFPSTSITLPSPDGISTTQILRGEEGNLNIAGRDTYLFTTGPDQDITGTLIRSTLPIAVFSGHRCAQVPYGITACDHLVQQIPPHVVWGRLFFTVPVFRRFEGVTHRSGERYRIGAVHADTEVTATCVGVGSNNYTERLRVNIPGGNPNEIENTGDRIIQNWAIFNTSNEDDPQYCCIEASRPVIVMQYSVGHSLNRPTSEQGDPFMVLVPPVRQYINNFTVTATKDISLNFTASIGVTVSSMFFDNSTSAHNSIQVDGNPLAPVDSGVWKPIYCSDGEVCGYGARQEVGAGSFNVFHTNPLAGLSVEVTGIANQASFGYTSGLEFEATGLAIVVIDDVEVREEAGTVDVTIRKVGGARFQVVFNVETRAFSGSGAGAIVGADYTQTTMNITMNRAVFSTTVTIPITIDTVPEPTERFELAIVQSTVNNAFLQKPFGVISILDIVPPTQPPVTFRFDPTSYTYSESVGMASLTIVKNAATTENITLEFSTAGDTAQAGSDYTEVSISVVTFGPDDLTQTVQVQILPDNVYERTERFFGNINNPSLGQIEVDGNQAEVFIQDETMLIVNFTTDLFPVPEDNGTINICLQTNAGSQEELVINVTATVKTTGSDLASADDFVPGTSTITFPPSTAGQVRCIQFTILDDNLALEGDETFNVEFMRVSGANAMPGPTNMAWGQIIDNDVVRVRFTEDNYAAREDEGPITACIIRDRPIASAFTVTVNANELSPVDAEDGVDFMAVSCQLTFEPNGPDTLCIDVPIINDTKQENPRENFEGVIEVPSTPGVGLGTPATATLIIIDDEALLVEFTTDIFPVPEDNGTINICLRTNIGSQEELVINVMATVKTTGSDLASADDFVPGTSTITFPPSTTGQVRCTQFTILDDTLALEGNETFNLEFMRVSGATAMPGTNRMAWGQIIDNDDVEIGFERPSYTVDEGDGSVTVCLVTSTGIARPVTVDVTSRESVPEDATESEDFEAETNQVTFPASSSSSTQCTSFTIINNDVAREGNENFVAVVVTPSDVRPGPITQTVITIVDDDADIGICRITSPLSISAFNRTETYRFSGTCEHTLVRSCVPTTPDFAVTVDFVSEDLSNGRIGLRYGISYFIYREDGSVVVYNAALSGEVGNVRSYNVSGSIVTVTTQSDGTVVIDAEDLGISIQASSSEFIVNTTSTSTQYNGLCGSSSGELIYSDCNTVANIANLTQVMEFANSHVVAARDQFLRDQSRQCGLISGYDTVIGDPLFTVPFLEDLTSLCFEVHGRTNTFINLVSDTCTSVNALYTAMQMPDNGNIISQVGVRAVGDSGQCYNVRVDLTGCATSVDGSPVTSSFNESGIRVRRTLNRVRISAPNCENKNLVMVVTCSLLPEPMIRFDIMRGLNLRPTSHGLLGQFWNIPITTQVFDADEDRYIVTVSPPGRPARRFITDRFNRVWDNSGRVCYYAGNGQGGRSGELPIADDSIIEGNYKNYLVADLYADEFVYNEFENERCAP